MDQKALREETVRLRAEYETWYLVLSSEPFLYIRWSFKVM